MKFACSILGVSHRRFGWLVGNFSEANVFRWANGKTGIAPFYYDRILVLLWLRLTDRLDTTKVRYIDWERGDVIFNGEGQQLGDKPRFDLQNPRRRYKGKGIPVHSPK